MKSKKKNIFTISLSNKSMIGLLNAGFIDARTKTVKKGMNLSKLFNLLVENHVVGKSYDAAIAYFKRLIIEEQEKINKSQQKMREWKNIIDELKNQKNDIKKTD